MTRISQKESALKQDEGESSDYTLKADFPSCWITVNNVSVYILNDGYGVSVELLPLGHAAEDAYDFAYAPFEDIRRRIEEYESNDEEDEEEEA